MPILTPDWPAGWLVTRLGNHKNPYLVGCLLMLVAGGLLAPWSASLSMWTRKTESRFPAIFVAQITSVAASTFTTGAIFTMLACIKYFTNDRGQSLAERGTEQLGRGPARVTAVRLLAVTGLVTLTMTIGYTLPNSWFGAHSTEWNKDIQTCIS